MQDQAAKWQPTHLVGVGASAGGLEALERLFKALPTETGMAFAVVQHLSPDFKSLMDELLARFTHMAIHRVEDGMRVEANCIYLMPPKMEMTVDGDRLRLAQKHANEGLSLPIDTFLESLAKNWGLQSVAVILSGTGSDGSRGIRHIHEAGGLVLSQSVDSAKFDGMPRSAEKTGVVDLVQSPEEIAETLARYANFPVGDKASLIDKPAIVDEDSMNWLMRMLREEFEIDFAAYKSATVVRRIERRVLLSQATDFEAYVKHLAADSTELNSLYKDLLIGVTAFFRDPGAFEQLRNAIPDLLQRLDAGDQFRAWVAGCATGEEAYTLAILLFEALEDQHLPLDVKIFATDVHRASLDHAGAGIYPEGRLVELSAERRRRFFTRTARGYQLIPEIRQMIVFAPHNVISDAPFTKLDLVTCRNLLIYFQPEAQTRVLSLFHFALKKNGVLFLGPSESLGELENEFDAIDAHWKLYRKKRQVRLTRELQLPIGAERTTARGAPATTPIARVFSQQGNPDLTHAYDELLNRHMPAGILLSDQRELVHVFGDVTPYIKLQPGRPSRDAIELFAPKIRAAANGAIHRASRDQEIVHYSGLKLTDDEDSPHLRLEVQPIFGKDGKLTHLMVTFEPIGAAPVASRELDLDAVARERMEDLERELRASRENLQATIEELETSNEELQATNEELVASNEELQSTNEELHSVNEELYTVNAEYQKKIAELTELTDDFNHLFEYVAIGILFLDRNLTVRKFTKSIGPVFHLMPQDVGRSFSSFAHSLDRPSLPDDIRSVIDHDRQIEKEVHSRDGRWYVMRIQPYHSRGKVDGAVLELFDLTEVRKTCRMIRGEVQRMLSVMDQLPHLICVTDAQGTYLTMNEAYARAVGVDRADVAKKSYHDVLPREAADTALQVEQEVFRTGRSVRLTKVLGLDGGHEQYQGVKFPIRSDSGHIDAVGTILRLADNATSTFAGNALPPTSNL